MAGVDLRTVAELLGHSTTPDGQRYSHLASELQTSAVDRLVKARTKRNTKSDAGGSAGKVTKRINVASN